MKYLIKEGKIAWIFICLVLYTTLGIGQDLPKVIPPSPVTQQFEKYGNYPVSNFTGIADIQIPLYTVQEGDLTVPITLSYHASGTKPTDVSGFVGMGWTLNTGGKISRTMMDKPDETISPPSVFYTSEQLVNMTPTYMRNYYFNYWDNTNDVEPDIFNYNFNGHQGKFILKQDAARTPLLLPYKPLLINHHLPSGGLGNLDFEITDENGVNYKFASSEFSYAYAAPAAFDLSCITSAKDASNKIFFTSQSGPYEAYFNKRIDQFATDDEPDNTGVGRTCYANDDPGGDGWTGTRPMSEFMDYDVPLLSGAGQSIGYSGTYPYQVLFRNGKVEFSTFNTNDDLKGMMQKMTVYNKSGTILKSFEFVYLDLGVGRVLLKEIKLFDSQHIYQSSYKFDNYNENYTVPLSLTASVDYWGYFNGYIANTNKELLPAWDITYPEAQRQTRTPGIANRVTNFEYMRTYVLNKIIYPSGGYTTFDYEANQYTTASTTGAIPFYSGTDVGGLRIKTISNYKFPGAVPEIKSYMYSNGIMDFLPGNIEDYSYSQIWFIPDWGQGVNITPWNGFRRRYYQSEPLFNITPHGSPVVYQTVTEYVGDGVLNTGKTVFNYDYTAAEKTTYPSNGTTTSKYDNVLYRSYLKPFKDWLSGNLVGKTYYKYINGNYLPVQSESYEYTETPGDEVRGFIKDRYLFSTSDNCTAPHSGQTLEDLYSTWGGVYSSEEYPYNFGDYYITSGYHHLTSTETDLYNNQGLNPAYTTTTYQYGNLTHDQVTQKTVSSSTGDNWITQYKYPHDFVSQSPYDIMVNTTHQWSPVIEQLSYKNVADNSHFLQATKTDYQIWNSNNAQIYPATVSTKKGLITNTYDPRVNFLGYDSKGNIQAVSKANGPKINYVWGYGGSYPIAQITNADYSAVVSVLGGQSAVDSFRDIAYPTDTQVKNFVQLLQSISGAQITTYTYKPLVGMTSMTDPRGQTTYYTYDNFQRLYQIKDHDQNIVKQYCYNYAGQQTDCTIPIVVTGGGQTTIYARIELDNINSSYSTVGAYNHYLSTGEGMIKFYSDVDCTQPYTLTSSMTVRVHELHHYDDDYSYVDHDNYYNYTVPANVSSYSLSTLTLNDDQNWDDENDDYHYIDDDYSYDVITLSGSDYTPAETQYNY